MKPIFSIIIPVYKVEKYIAQCIESVLTQTLCDFEVLCVDDCGNDSSIEIIKKYAKKDKRIKILHHEKNKGLSAARNTALDVATGDYIVCLDSDDWLESDCLEVLYNEFLDKKTNSIWFDAYRYDDSLQKRLDGSVGENKAGFMELTPENITYRSDYTWIKAYKTNSIKKYNLHWPEGLTFEDGEFYFKYFTLNPKTYVTEKCLYNYRIREGSIVTNAHVGNIKIQDIYQIVRNIRNFYIENGLYEKYKIALLHLLNARINTCKNICNHYEISLNFSKEILEEFGFPDEFKEFEK